MTYDPREQFFLYHGYGLGVGGHVERYGQKLAIPSLAPVVLPITGGESYSKSGPWEWKPDDEPPTSEGGFRISVRGVSARLWTEENRKEWITNAEIRVSGFNLCDRVEVGFMVAKLRSVHKKKHVEKHPRISFEGSGFWNVRIDKQPVPIELDNDLDQCASRDELKKLVKERDYLAEAEHDDYMHELIEKHVNDDYTRCSIVRNIRHPKKRGFSVDLDGFGRIFLGEMLVADNEKRLSMVRWNLGCDNCGDGTSGSPSVNGDSMP
jgi:hypothetical protein